MYAAHNKVDNLIGVVDYNGQQIDGPVDKVNSLGNLKMKWEAFGWDVMEVEKGNDMASVVTALEQANAKSRQGKPVMILLHTQMGAGVDFMMGSHKWHGAAPNDEQLATALNQLECTLGDY
jgi:transketolase